MLSQVTIRELIFLAAIVNADDESAVHTALLMVNTDPRTNRRYNLLRGRLAPATTRTQASAATRALLWALPHLDPLTNTILSHSLPDEPYAALSRYPLLELRPIEPARNAAFEALMDLVKTPAR